MDLYGIDQNVLISLAILQFEILFLSLVFASCWCNRNKQINKLEYVLTEQRKHHQESYKETEKALTEQRKHQQKTYNKVDEELTKPITEQRKHQQETYKVYLDVYVTQIDLIRSLHQPLETLLSQQTQRRVEIKTNPGIREMCQLEMVGFVVRGRYKDYTENIKNYAKKRPILILHTEDVDWDLYNALYIQYTCTDAFQTSEAYSVKHMPSKTERNEEVLHTLTEKYRNKERLPNRERNV